MLFEMHLIQAVISVLKFETYITQNVTIKWFIFAVISISSCCKIPSS